MQEDIFDKTHRIFNQIIKHTNINEQEYLQTTEAETIAKEARVLLNPSTLKKTITASSSQTKRATITLVEGYTLGHFVCGVEATKRFKGAKEEIAKALEADGIDPQIMKEIIESGIPLKEVKCSNIFVALTKIFGEFHK